MSQGCFAASSAVGRFLRVNGKKQNHFVFHKRSELLFLLKRRKKKKKTPTEDELKPSTIIQQMTTMDKGISEQFTLM